GAGRPGGGAGRPGVGGATVPDHRVGHQAHQPGTGAVPAGPGGSWRAALPPLQFRTMVDGAHAMRDILADRNESDGLLFKIRDDPRVTRVGRWLRRWSLDELPQLLNVVLGQMSLVGPRPPLPEEVARYDGDVARRLLVKPGITGLWQVSGRSDLSWEDRVRLDLYYVENWALATDVVVVWKAVGAVLRQQGAY